MRIAVLRSVFVVLACIIATSLCGCTRLERFEFTRLCMGVQTRVVVYAPGRDRAADAAAAAFATIAEVEQSLSDYRPDSEAMRLCARADAGEHGWQPVSPVLALAIERSLAVSEATDGAFAPTIGPAGQLWRRSRQTRTLPTPEQVAEAVRLSAPGNIELDADRREVRILQPGVRLDFGGTGKGLAAHHAVEMLRKHGCSRSLVALGGDIAVGAPPPGAAGWRIDIAGVERPLLFSNAVVSTSGDTEQWVEINGRGYSHIVDPRTGLGFDAPRGVQVTVIARDGAFADALGTALYALPLEQAEHVVKRFDAGAIIVTVPPQEPGVREIDPHGLIRWAGITPSPQGTHE